jgi:N-acetylglucosamine-6-phosphate deacetylase
VKTTFVNGAILTDDGFRDDLAVVIEGERIASVGCEVAGEQIDLRGKYLVPGFVDLQVNGGGDAMLNDSPDAATMRQIADAHARFGTTALMPTLISDAPEKFILAIEAFNSTRIPGVIGLHLEGPFLSPARKGMHDALSFRSFDEKSFAALTSLTHGVMMLTVAPEVVSPSDIARLASAGVIIAAGHSDADYETVRAALDAGLAGFTHLFNAMSPLQSRAPGMVGAALEDGQSWCGIIADGYHVHPATLKIAIAAKPKGKVILVTDAMAPVGGTSNRFTYKGEEIICDGGRCETKGSLAGSCLDMASAVRNVVHWCDVPLDEACRMASLYPAAAIGQAELIGRINSGYRADIVALDRDLEVNAVWRGGERLSG